MTETRGRRELVMRRGISRRDFLKVGGAGLAGAAVLGVAGCGGGDSGQGNGGGGTGGGGGGNKTQLNFAYGPTGDNDRKTAQELVDKFNQQSDSIQVSFRKMAQDTGEYFQQIRQELQAGATDADIIAGDVIWPIQFAANGWIADLSDMFTDSEQKSFLDGPLQSMRYKDGIYGVPWFTDAGLLYYRKDLLDNAGISEPPKTWDELKQIAGDVTQSQGVKNGFVFQGDEYEGGVCDALEFVWTHGGRVQPEGDSSKIIIDSSESAAGLATERSMIKDGVSPQAVANWKETESLNTFLQGNAVFMRNWPYAYGEAGGEGSKVSQEQIGVTTIPVSGGNSTVSTLGGWNFYIIESSKKKEAAYEFAKFMTAPEQQKYRALEGSYLPTVQSLYDDEEIKKQVPVIELGRQALQNTRPRPPSPVYSDLSQAMQEQFKASLTGSTTPEKAVGTLQQKLSNMVQQAQG